MLGYNTPISVLYVWITIVPLMLYPLLIPLRPTQRLFTLDSGSDDELDGARASVTPIC